MKMMNDLFEHEVAPAAGLLWPRKGARRCIIMLALILCTSNVFAQARRHEGSRPGAMGGAFLALSNDVNALAFNPAGLTYVPQKWMAEFSLQNPFGSGLPFREKFRNEGALTASSFGIVHNRLHKPNQTQPVLVFGGADLSQSMPASSQIATANVYSLGLAGSFFNSGLLNEFYLSASLSKGIFRKDEPAPHTHHLSPRLAFGMTAKLLGLQYEGGIAQNAEVNSEEERAAIASFFAEHGRSQLSFGADVGLMAELHPNVHAALLWANALPPNLALQGTVRAPRSLRGGLALLLDQRRQWLLACDYERNEAFPRNRFYFGMESGLAKIAPEVLRARVGLNRNWISAGFMLAKPGFAELHYAFLLPAFFSEDRPEGFFQHRFSVAFAKAP